MDGLFDFPQVKIDKKIRIITLFSGIGSQEMALRDIGADFEIHRMVEFDKYACKAYNAIHGTDFTPTDVKDVKGSDLGITDKDKYSYIMFYSFPCTSLSVAGKMEGMKEGSGTASSLLWEVKRIIDELPKAELPDFLIMENVPQVCSKSNLPEFNKWLSFLRNKGYYNFYDILNAKNFGIPQNRERCFMISILSDEFVEFEFPKTIPLTKVMKDYLEDEVDEKYYINSEKADKLIAELMQRGELPTENREQRTIHTVDLCVKRPRRIYVANCIKARYDAGISNLQADGSGVVEICRKL